MSEATPMIEAAQKGYQREPTSPGAVLADGLNAARESNMATAAISTIAAAVATWYGLTWPLWDPLELRRDVLMELLVLLDELEEVGSGLEVGLERVVAHELLPLVGVVHLLEHIDPELLLSRGESGRRHDRAHDEVVVDRDALRFAGGKAHVDGGRGAGRHERAERPKLLGLVQLESLARVVDGGHDTALMSGEGRGDCCARSLGDVRERLRLHRVLDASEECLVLLFCAGAGDGHRVLLGRGDEVLRGLPRAVVIDPEEEGVQSEIGDRGEVRRLERKLLRDDGREEAVERDHHVVHVTRLLVHVLECDRAGAALLIERGHRLRRELLGLDDGRHRARIDVRASAGRGANYELNRVARLDHG